MGTDIKLFELEGDLEENIGHGDVEVDHTGPIFALIWFQHVSTRFKNLERRCQLLARGVHSGVVGGNGRSPPPGPGSCTQPGKTEAEGPKGCRHVPIFGPPYLSL